MMLKDIADMTPAMTELSLPLEELSTLKTGCKTLISLRLLMVAAVVKFIKDSTTFMRTLLITCLPALIL